MNVGHTEGTPHRLSEKTRRQRVVEVRHVSGGACLRGLYQNAEIGFVLAFEKGGSLGGSCRRSPEEGDWMRLCSAS